MGGWVVDRSLCICQTEFTPYVYPHALYSQSTYYIGKDDRTLQIPARCQCCENAETT